MKSIAKTLSALPRWAAWGALMFGATLAQAAKVNDLAGGPAVRQLNLHPPVTQIAKSIDELHWMIMIISTLLFLIVCAAMVFSIVVHRKSRGAKPAQFSESIPVEVTWTLVPFLIVVLMAMPATKTIVAQKDTTNSDITIKATGYQWKWGYDYLTGEGAGISFLSALDTKQRELSSAGTPEGDDYLFKVDNPLVLPVDKKIRVITTANDVIHSWFVPSFGVKQDAIPGLVRDTWFRVEKVGDYYGSCAELCGKEHAYMPIHVKILSQEDYSDWVKEQQGKQESAQADPDKTWTLAELTEHGKDVYAANCAACHQANGEGSGAVKPLDGSKIVQGAPAEQMHVVLEGRGNGAMPAWTQLSDQDLAAVVTYTKNSWSNDTGQVVQPSEFKAARDGHFPRDSDSANAGADHDGASTAADASAGSAADAKIS